MLHSLTCLHLLAANVKRPQSGDVTAREDGSESNLYSGAVKYTLCAPDLNASKTAINLLAVMLFALAVFLVGFEHNTSTTEGPKDLQGRESCSHQDAQGVKEAIGCRQEGRGVQAASWGGAGGPAVQGGLPPVKGVHSQGQETKRFDFFSRFNLLSPPHSSGMPARENRLRRGETEEGRSSLLEKETFVYVNRARTAYTPLPTHLPLRGACFGLAFVMCSLLAVLLTERQDLVTWPLGSWSPDPANAGTVGVSVWLDGRNFLSKCIPVGGV